MGWHNGTTQLQRLLAKCFDLADLLEPIISGIGLCVQTRCSQSITKAASSFEEQYIRSSKAELGFRDAWYIGTDVGGIARKVQTTPKRSCRVSTNNVELGE
jgi:hypothetical protein